MGPESEKRLPLWRLAIYLVIFAICGWVTAREFYYALAGNTTTATVLTVGKTSASSRTLRYGADYEYFDSQQARHVGRAENVHPTTNPFDQVEVQYLRHAPGTSRLAPTPVKGLCFGFVALLAIVVFVAEIVIRRRRRLADAEQTPV